MAKFNTAFVAIAVLLATTVSLGSCARDPLDYLNYKASDSAGEIKWLQQQVEAKAGAEPADVETFLTELHKHVQDLIASGSAQATLPDPSFAGLAIKKLWRILIDINNEPVSSVECFPAEVKGYVRVVDAVFGFQAFASLVAAGKEPTHDLKLFKYLRELGLNHFTVSCLKDFQPEPNASPSKPSEKVALIFQQLQAVDQVSKVESQFDEMISLEENHVDDSKLTALAEQLDFVHGQFNARKMAKIIDNPDSGSGITRSSKAQKMLKFLKNSCRPLRSSATNQFDAYNLGRALAPTEASSVKLPQRLLKMNEYMRLCLPADEDYLWPTVLENIQANIDNSGSWLQRKIKNMH